MFAVNRYGAIIQWKPSESLSAADNSAGDSAAAARNGTDRLIMGMILFLLDRHLHDLPSEGVGVLRVVG